MSNFSMNTEAVKRLVPELDEAATKLKAVAAEMEAVFTKVGVDSETDILQACAKGIQTITQEVVLPNLKEAGRITEELLENAIKVDRVTEV